MGKKDLSARGWPASSALTISVQYANFTKILWLFVTNIRFDIELVVEREKRKEERIQKIYIFRFEYNIQLCM